MLKWNAKVVVREDWGASEASCVLTKDGRYRRCKIISKLKEGGAPKWGACFMKKFKGADKAIWLPCEVLGDGSPKYYKDEDAATTACESHAESRQKKITTPVPEKMAKTAPTTPEPEKKAPEPEKTAKTTPEPEKKAPEKKKAKKAPKPSEKKPGVFKVIIDVLRHASPLSPVTKDGILEALKESFPDREEDGMKATINTQVPSGLRIRKGLIVEKNDRGYWLP
jgi:hypothetical protein